RGDGVKDTGHRLQVAEVDEERERQSDDDEVWKHEGPPAGPGAPISAAQIGDIDADLDGERSRKRLADRDRLAHLAFGEPLAVIDKFALHLSHQRNRSAEAQKTEPQEVTYQFGDLPLCRRFRHVVPHRSKY